MLWTTLKRIAKSGAISFARNGVITLASILVMTVTLFVLGSFVFLNAMMDKTLDDVKKKVDINVYFVPDAVESEILAVKTKLEKRGDIDSVEYTSQQKATKEFRERHKTDAVIIGALDELDSNPLGAYLNVQAKDTADYEQIALYLNSKDVLSKDGSKVILNTNYFNNKEAIKKLTDIIQTMDMLSVAVLVFFAFISILITFNTIRLAIYNSKDEIAVMRLVGASSAYVRGPFVIEGVLYGSVSAIIALILFYPVSLWIGPMTANFFGSANMFDYYIDNFGQLFLLLIGVGIILGALSSFFAVRKYLKV